MNTFVVIEEFGTFEKVKFYTVRLEIDGEEEALTETDKFLEKFKDVNHVYYEELGIIIKLIKVIGQRGAKNMFFRFENSAVALPGKGRRVEEIVLVSDSKLRLYCIRLNENAVVLCNGGVKTEHKAQNCPNVSQYFRMANKISNKLNQSLAEGDLRLCGKELKGDQEIGFYL